MPEGVCGCGEVALDVRERVGMREGGGLCGCCVWVTWMLRNCCGCSGGFMWMLCMGDVDVVGLL